MYLVETGPKPEPSPAATAVPPGPKPEPSPAATAVPPGPKPEPSPAATAVPSGQDYGFTFNLRRLIKFYPNTFNSIFLVKM